MITPADCPAGHFCEGGNTDPQVITSAIFLVLMAEASGQALTMFMAQS